MDAGVPLGVLSGAECPPIFCDRGVLLNVAAALEHERGIVLNLRYCSIHIIRNMTRNYNVRGKKLDGCIFEVQGASTIAKYEEALMKLKANFGADVEAYVPAIPPRKWTVHATETKLYGWRSTNFVESHNAVLDRNGLRRDSPFQALKLSAKQAMTALSSRAQEHAKWTKKALSFTPFASKCLQAQQAEAGAYDVAVSSSTVCFVTRQGTQKDQRVCSRPIACSCITFIQMGLPCRHIFKVLNFANQQSRLKEAFDKCYLVSSFTDFASISIELAVDHRLEVSTTVVAPPTYTQVGRPSTRRIRSAGEGGGGAVYRCRNCGQGDGHNKRTCRRHGATPYAPPSQLSGVAVPLGVSEVEQPRPLQAIPEAETSCVAGASCVAGGDVDVPVVDAPLLPADLAALMNVWTDDQPNSDTEAIE